KELHDLPEKGLLHLLIKHTSAGLTLNENADPSVRSDFESFINKLIPEDHPVYTHVFEGIDELLPLMTANNTPAFVTHTVATVKQTQDVIKLEVKHATHFYDVFPCPEVTEPGVRPCGAVEAVLADKNVSVDFILDGVHVDPIAVKMALACKTNGSGKLCLITDSNVGAGLEPGRFNFGNSGEVEFAYKGAPARMVENNGLAGSGLTMDQALRNAVKWLDISLHEAVKLVSTNPAEVIGLGHRKGKLDIGYDADFVVLDQQLNVNQTWIAGKQCFKN
ncbi:MAG: YjbQ family protein, partial [Bacteroidota bacterium]